MRLLRKPATAADTPDATAVSEQVAPADADDAPAADVAYRVDDDLDAQALPDFNLITADGVESVEPADAE